MKVYISGKVRGLPMKAVREAFDKAEKRLQAMGADVVNPLLLVEEMEEDVKVNERKLMLSLLMELSHCDAIWMLDNWKQDSHGAACEYHFALSSGIRVMNVPEEGVLEQLLSQKYRSNGDTEDIVLKTTSEIAYELDDMVDAGLHDVAKWLHDHGFKTMVRNDIHTWILYEVS